MIYYEHIPVNSIDNTRMDLVIPGQQHMYLRAPSPQDRQKWLVALGSAKACLESIVDTKGIYHLTFVYPWPEFYNNCNYFFSDWI